MPKRAPARLTKPRRLAFAFILVAIAVAALAIAELACRAFGFGGYPPVIERIGQDAGGTWFATSRRGTDTFFPAVRSLTGGMRELQFVTPKPRGAVRIVLLGESAIQGFPQELPLTNGAFLESMLHDLWRGERRVEVLNFGATAVASFPVTRFLDAVLEHEPDLVVLMLGNNEYYGAYGVASLHSAGASPLGMRVIRAVRSLGLSQWLRSLRARDDDGPRSGTLMELAAVKRQIRHDDPLREAAAKSLRTHLDWMVQRCASRNVPVIVCTAPANERDLAPIGRDADPTLAPEARAAFDRDLRLAGEALASDPAAAAGHARAAIELHGAHAGAHFIAAEALGRLGRFDEARAAYIRARDLDTMPWRATSMANDAARAAAARGAVLCDVEAVFRAQSPTGVVGWELMDDHVHMSVRGQALFARAIVDAMRSLAEPLSTRAEEIATLPGWETYAARLGRSVFSDFVAATHMRKLFAIPFMRANNEAAFGRFDARCDSLLASMSAPDREAAQRWLDPNLHGIADRPIEFVVGAYRMSAGDYESAAAFFEIARAGVPLISSWRMELNWSLLQCARHLRDQPMPRDRQLCEETIRVGELLDRFGSARDTGVLRHLGLAYNLAGNHAAAVAALEPAAPAARGREGWEVVAALADSYVQLGRLDDAKRLLAQAAEDTEVGAAARSLLGALPQADLGTRRPNGGAEAAR